MIQRRRAAPGSGPSGTPASPPSQANSANAAYQPLRPTGTTPASPPARFGAAPAFTPRANHVHNNSSVGGFSAFSPMMGAAGIGGIGAGIGAGTSGGATGLGQYVEETESGPVLRRVARQMRAGVKDMGELGRSWSLVWG